MLITARHLIIGLLFLTSFEAHSACNILMQRLANFRVTPVFNIGPQELQSHVNRLEWQSTIMRRLRQPPTPALNLAHAKKMAIVDDSIIKGDYSVAHRELRGLFRNYELELLSHRFNKMAKEIIAQDREINWTKLNMAGIPMGHIEAWQQTIKFDSTLSQANKFFDDNLKRAEYKLGTHYHFYMTFRHHLEQLLNHPNCDIRCQENMKHLTKSIGLESETERARFQSLIGDAAIPSLDEIKMLINSSSAATVQKLRVERNAELIWGIHHLFLQTSFINFLHKMTAELPGLKQTRLVRLFQMMYDQQARTLDFPVINELLRRGDSGEKLLASLKEFNNATENDRLLVNLARRSDGQARDLWAQALIAAQEEADNSFKHRMESALNEAQIRGQISAIQQSSGLFRLAAVALGGGSLLYFSISDTNFDEITQFITQRRLPESQESISEVELELLAQELISLSENYQKEIDRSPDSISWWERFWRWFGF